jgi:serine/threonine protein kinase
MARGKPQFLQVDPEEWARCEAAISRFEEACRQGPAPLLDDFLPAARSARLAVLAELVHVELEYRGKRGQAIAVEPYLQRYPELAGDAAAVVSLLRLEAQLRGLLPAAALQEQLQRFPQYRTELVSQYAHTSADGRDQAAPHSPDTPAESENSQLRHTPATEQPEKGAPGGPVLPGFPGYELLSVLGRGGMGIVYKARQTRLDRLVAIKVISPELLARDHAVRRFEREARAAARLSHPNIITVYDAGESDGMHYLVMEYANGMDLGRLLKLGGRVPVRQAADYVRQAALGLAHAHDKGLVHRDIKPGNLMLISGPDMPGDGTVKILDLGLARLRGADTADAGSTLTQVGGVMGTPDYLAPEQARNARDVDGRADQYSLGCTLYHLLTGRVPFSGRTVTDKVIQHARDLPPAVDELCPDVPVALSRIVARLMAKEPGQRFAGAAECAAALQEFLHGRPAASVPRAGPRSPARDTMSFSEVIPAARAAIRECRRLLGHTEEARAVAFAPGGGCVLSGSRDGTLRMWDPLRGTELARWEAHPGGVHDVAFTPDGARALSCGSDGWCVWDTATAHLLGRCAAHAGDVLCLAPTPDGRRVLSGGQDQTVRLSDAATGQELLRFGHLLRQRHWDTVLDVAVAADGCTAASASRDRTVRLWDMATGQELRTLTDHSGPVHAVAFTPDGRALATAGGLSIRLWDTATGRLLHRLKGHAMLVTSLAASADGHLLLSGSEDNSTRIWHLGECRQLGSFTGRRAPVRAVAVGPAGTPLVAAAVDRFVSLWELPPNT